MWEFRPILSALGHHKTSSLLVVLQIGVTLAIIVNSAFIINQRIEKINRPTGMDVDNIIVADLRGIGDDYDGIANIERDLKALRSLPGVAAVSVTNQVPLSGSGSSMGLRAVADLEVTSTPTARYRLSDEGLNALGTSLIEGRNFYPEEIEYYIPGETVMITRVPA